ncbi:MAG: signal peptidase II [bacterium]|nr:signal peptidase II [bacterium]
MWLTALFVLLFDQLSKWFAVQQGWVVYNPGLSFGVGQESSRIVLTVILIVGVGVAWKVLKQERQSAPIVAGLFFGGAVSNILDRVLQGAVIDWIPLFLLPLKNNLADWAIFIALCIWLVQLLQAKQNRK